MLSIQKPTLNPYLKDFWTTQARNKVLYGGRDSSKTWDAAGFAIFLASNYKLRFLCTRQFQNKIEESVYTTLKIQIERFGLKDMFRVLDNKIICPSTGSEFIFYGLWRNIDEIKSLEGIDVCWIEEAHNLTKNQWDILEPTIRKEGSEFWIIFNPGLMTDFVYQRFVIAPPPNTLVRKINFTENPFLSETSKQIIEAKKIEDIDEYNHKYLGSPLQNDDKAIIKRSWIEACIDAHIKLNIDVTGKERIGYDIADDGGDLNAIVHTKGILAYHLEDWKGGMDELNLSATKVWNKARNIEAQIIYDCIGVGASAGSKFKELNDSSYVKVEYEKFNAGDAVQNPNKEVVPKVTNKERFANLKAQMWWDLANRMQKTHKAVTNGTPIEQDEIISISSSMPKLEKLMQELTTPQKDYDNTGKLKVESKKDLKGRGISSPNLADAFIMAYYQVNSNAIWW